MSAPTLYKQVPSAGAITRAQAIACAKKRWPWAFSGDETETVGIEWQGNHGTRHTALWAALAKVDA